MKYLNLIKNLIKLPFVILVSPLFLIVWFFMTNWEDSSDRKYVKEFFKALYW